MDGTARLVRGVRCRDARNRLASNNLSLAMVAGKGRATVVERMVWQGR